MKTQALCLICLAGVTPSMLLAQDQGGIQYTLDVSQQLEATTNRDLSDTSTTAGQDYTTSLGFSMISETRNEIFAFAAGLDVGLANDSSATFNPSASLSYERSIPSATLSLDADWAQSDIVYLQEEAVLSGEIPDDFEDLTGSGTRTIRSGAAALRWGEDDPIAYSFGIELSETRYDDANSALVDSAQSAFTGGLSLRINPVTTADVSLRYNRRDPEGSEVETSAVLTNRLTFARPLGNVTADFSVIRDEEGGTRFSTAIGRTLDFPDRSLDLRIGLTETDTQSAALTGRVGYQQDLPTGQISVVGQRRAGRVTTTDNLNAAFAFQVTEISNLQFGFDYLRQRDSDTGDSTAIKSLSISYGTRLTEEWQMNFGARNEMRNASGVTSQAGTLFVALDRSFSFQR